MKFVIRLSMVSHKNICYEKDHDGSDAVSAAGLMLMAFRPSPTTRSSQSLSASAVVDTVPAHADSTSGTDTAGEKTDTPAIQVDTGSTTPPGI